MKLAEALVQRADTQKYIAQLSTRLKVNAKHQEGVAPAEDPAFLRKELAEAVTNLQWLISHINSTNMACVCEGRTLTDMLAERDAKTIEVVNLRNFLAEASELHERYSRTEIKMLSSVDVAQLRREVDEKAKHIRQLDMKIQELNWTTELV